MYTKYLCRVPWWCPVPPLPLCAALIALHNFSKHALQLICIALSYMISADLRSTYFARLGVHGGARIRACRRGTHALCGPIQHI